VLVNHEIMSMYQNDRFGPLNVDEAQRGDSVVHRRFGRGMIEALLPGRPRLAIIAFEGVGLKKVNADEHAFRYTDGEVEEQD